MEKMLYRAELDMQTFEAPAAPGVTGYRAALFAFGDRGVGRPW